MGTALAIKYRPKTFEDLTEQSAVVTILTNQIETNTVKHGYLFCGGAGTGKTTSARIFANMINKGQGEPIELDAASNNSVEDIRRLTEQAQTKALDAEYKIFIIDECHSLSNQAWQAMLKTLEEPPSKSIFIFCTTDPQKIPNTILSRVQRYNFQRISQDGVVSRLFYILEQESPNNEIDWEANAIDYIAKIADGGMRDAITLMDKCLSYSNKLDMANVIKALGVADYNTMCELTDMVVAKSKCSVIDIISAVYSSGMDIKQFIKDYFEFILDLNIFRIDNSSEIVKIPYIYLDGFKSKNSEYWNTINKLLEFSVGLYQEIKWAQNPKQLIIARFMLFLEEL